MLEKVAENTELMEKLFINAAMIHVSPPIKSLPKDKDTAIYLSPDAKNHEIQQLPYPYGGSQPIDSDEGFPFSKEETRKLDKLRNAQFKDFCHTITSDNGMEFANHQEIAQKLETDFFFAKPYHSWQRGLNEHTNGLVRQYFPKKTNLAMVTNGRVAKVQWLLNNRPRKVLNFKTPLEVFYANLTNLNAQTVALHC